MLAVGDTLLLRGDWQALEASWTTRTCSSSTRPRGAPAGGPARSGCEARDRVLAAMVVLLATGAVPPAVAGLLAAGAIVLSGVLTIEQAYRGIGWTTVILVAGMIPMSTAMTTSGAAEPLADRLVDIVGGHGPHALLLGVVLLVFVARPADREHGDGADRAADRRVGGGRAPRLAEAAPGRRRRGRRRVVLTPVATPANLMVMGPGGYRFGDYWKLGLPLLVLYGIVAVFLVPLIWSF